MTELDKQFDLSSEFENLIQKHLGDNDCIKKNSQVFF